MTETQALQEAILSAPLDDTTGNSKPKASTTYFPPSHIKALRLDIPVVVGDRGVGKSFWTNALQSRQLRSSIPGLEDVSIHIGFSVVENIRQYPNADVFQNCLSDNIDPYDLWRAVLLRWIAGRESQDIPLESWQKTVFWLKNNPEVAAHLLEKPRNWKGLVLFDALDRTSHIWSQMDDIVRGLLRALLWLKSFPGLHGKVFLRQDQAERPLFNFPDASKLASTKADLTWATHDLHGLLWQRLINAPGAQGTLMRSICNAFNDKGWWELPENMKREGEPQRKAFERLAGPQMGRDQRRGVPYVWSVGHLADGRGKTSPRSFLAAIAQAAQDSHERYPDHQFALHYESIKRGIRKASEIRVAEVAEDYPWVPIVLNELKGMNVPCSYEDILSRWQQNLSQVPKMEHSGRLPAQHAFRGWDGILEDLLRLGLVEARKDGRIDMPDLYRVGFGLGRKGGVKPKG